MAIDFRRTSRRGQALIELAIGMFTLALVVTALCGFAVYIARSLRVQNSQRGPSPEHAEPVKIGRFGSEWVFGSETLKIDEPFYMPERIILK